MSDLVSSYLRLRLYITFLQFFCIDITVDFLYNIERFIFLYFAYLPTTYLTSFLIVAKWSKLLLIFFKEGTPATKNSHFQNV